MRALAELPPGLDPRISTFVPQPYEVHIPGSKGPVNHVGEVVYSMVASATILSQKVGETPALTLTRLRKAAQRMHTVNPRSVSVGVLTVGGIDGNVGAGLAKLVEVGLVEINDGVYSLTKPAIPPLGTDTPQQGVIGEVYTLMQSVRKRAGLRTA